MDGNGCNMLGPEGDDGRYIPLVSQVGGLVRIWTWLVLQR